MFFLSPLLCIRFHYEGSGLEGDPLSWWCWMVAWWGVAGSTGRIIRENDSTENSKYLPLWYIDVVHGGGQNSEGSSDDGCIQATHNTTHNTHNTTFSSFITAQPRWYCISGCDGGSAWSRGHLWLYGKTPNKKETVLFLKKSPRWVQILSLFFYGKFYHNIRLKAHFFLILLANSL